jgi:MFS family permease
VSSTTAPANLDELQRKTVRTLTIGQALGGFGFGSTLSVGALMAVELTGTAAWSGAAATMATLGAAGVAMPLAALADRRGRRVALASGAALAILGAAGMIVAAGTRIFAIELVALFLLGSASAVSLQARFAANDLPIQRNRARDLSLVVWATTFGAMVGPNLIGPGETLGMALGLPHLGGPYALTIMAQLASTTVFWYGLRPDPLLLAQRMANETRVDGSRRRRRSIRQTLGIVRANPILSYSVLTIALSHMVMVSVMSMTPAHLDAHGHGLSAVGFTISLHVAGMYAFAPVFGWLSDRIGPRRVIGTGILVLITSAAISAIWQHEFAAVVLGLFLLGLGWSAATVAGSALLGSAVAIDDKPEVQGFSDSMMNLTGALGGAIAGIILTLVGFSGLNMLALIPVAAILLMTAYQLRLTKGQ